MNRSLVAATAALLFAACGILLASCSRVDSSAQETSANTPSSENWVTVSECLAALESSETLEPDLPELTKTILKTIGADPGLVGPDGEGGDEVLWHVAIWWREYRASVEASSSEFAVGWGEVPGDTRPRLDFCELQAYVAIVELYPETERARTARERIEQAGIDDLDEYVHRVKPWYLED